MARLMLSDALRELSGPLAEFHTKLCGADGNTVWLPAFKRFLRRENPWDGKPFFKAWKTITIGSYPTAEALIEAVEKAGMGVHDEVKTFAQSGKFSVAKEPKEVQLITPTIGELRLFGPTAHQIHLGLHDVGLMPLTVEMVLLARLKYTTQPDEDSIQAVTVPIDELILCLDNNYEPKNGVCVHAWVPDDSTWSEDAEVICAMPY